MSGIDRHIPCPVCPSSDAYSVNPRTGWGECFSCGHKQPPEGDHKIDVTEEPVRKAFAELSPNYGHHEDRGISKATHERYKVWTHQGNTYFPVFKGKKHVGNHIRYGDKRFAWEGTNKADLFGTHLFPPGSAKAITLTEGYEDAEAAFELLGSKYPVVSILGGAPVAERECRDAYEYLDSFDEIVVCFDGDEPGQEAAKQVAGIFAPGKVRIMSPRKHKDANDYLKARAHGEFTKEWWQAPRFMPDGLKIGSNMWDEIVNRPQHFQVDYPFAGLNKMTYGIRLSELVVLTADTGIGKTSLLKEIEYSLLMHPELIEKGYGVGFLHLEEPNYDTALGLLSIHDSKPYHLPDTERSMDALRAAYDAVVNNNRVVIWDHFGSNTVDAVLDKVRHMHALGCKYIVLDHLSIVVSDQSGDERKQLDEITTKLKTLCMQLNIALICVIHQNRQGSIRGTAGVEQLANIVMKFTREMEATDPWRRNVTKIVVQKNRFCGRTGPAAYLWYNEMTGRLMELSKEETAEYEAGGGMRRDDMQPFN